ISKGKNMHRKNKDRVVERILDHKFINGSVSYLVKWHGYPDEENSWKLQDEISEAVNVKKQNEGNKMGRNSGKYCLGDSIPRFYEPDWDSHIECIETIYHDESSKDILAIIKWKSHKLRTLHSIEEVKRRCPQQ
ncbi:26227_t:CDS:2, partial [Racocetra persica]